MGDLEEETASTLDMTQKQRTSIAGFVSTPIQVLLTERTVIALWTFTASVCKQACLVLKHSSKYTLLGLIDNFDAQLNHKTMVISCWK